MRDAELLTFTTDFYGETAVMVVLVTPQERIDWARKAAEVKDLGAQEAYFPKAIRAVVVFTTNDPACALSEAIGSEAVGILDIVRASTTAPWRRVVGIDPEQVFEALRSKASQSVRDFDVETVAGVRISNDGRIQPCWEEPDSDHPTELLRVIAPRLPGQIDVLRHANLNPTTH